MNDIDTTFKTGRIVGDIELRYSTGGMAIADGKICFSYQKKDGSHKDNTVKFNVFGAEAEKVSKMLKNGMSVMMEGRTNGSTREYKGKTYHDCSFMVNKIKILKDEESSDEVPF